MEASFFRAWPRSDWQENFTPNTEALELFYSYSPLFNSVAFSFGRWKLSRLAGDQAQGLVDGKLDHWAKAEISYERSDDVSMYMEKPRF